MADEPPAKRVKVAKAAKRPEHIKELGKAFDVLVGQNALQKRYTIHNSVFIPRSEFFRAARSDAWNKDHSKPTDLQNEEPEVFENYMRCVYFGDLGALDGGEDLSVDLTGDHLTALIKLYVLADTLIDLKTANMVIDRIFAYALETKSLPSHDQVNLAYSSTALGNPLRSILRDFIVYNGHLDYLAHVKDSSTLHSDFCYDITAEYLRVKHSTTPYTDLSTAFSWNRFTLPKLNLCVSYHQHDLAVSKCEPPGPPPRQGYESPSYMPYDSDAGD